MLLGAEEEEEATLSLKEKAFILTVTRGWIGRRKKNDAERYY